MRRVGNLLAVVALVCGTAAFADSENGRGGGQENGQGGGQGNYNRSYGAPEPVTMAAVAVGAGVAGLAGWRARRKR